MVQDNNSPPKISLQDENQESYDYVAQYGDVLVVQKSTELEQQNVEHAYINVKLFS